MKIKNIAVFCLIFLSCSSLTPTLAEISEVDIAFFERLLSSSWKPAKDYQKSVLVSFSIDKDGEIQNVSGIQGLSKRDKESIEKALNDTSYKTRALQEIRNTSLEAQFAMSYSFGGIGSPSVKIWKAGPSTYLEQARVNFNRSEWKKALLNFTNHLKAYRPTVEVLAKGYICECMLESHPIKKKELAKNCLKYLERVKSQLPDHMDVEFWLEKIKVEATLTTI